MVTNTRNVTVEEFHRFIHQPENVQRTFELIGGEIVEVVANGKSSRIAALILTFIGMTVLRLKNGRVTGADGGYIVAGERYIPDVAFLSYARQQKPSYIEGYNTVAPEIAVEVLSPSNTESEIGIKITNYLAAGTILWLVDVEKEQVSVHYPGKSALVLRSGQTLTEATLLPGFALAIDDIFADEGDEAAL